MLTTKWQPDRSKDEVPRNYRRKPKFLKHPNDVSDMKKGSGQKYPQDGLEENGPYDKMNAFNVLIIVMLLVYVSLHVSWQELGRPVFLGCFWTHPMEEDANEE
jgi:hypothetical protein